MATGSSSCRTSAFRKFRRTNRQRCAGLSGITIPEIQLIPVAEISGLPPEAATVAGQTALAVRRFDRPLAGRRVHIEDFAQILGLYPEQKYASYNYET